MNWKYFKNLLSENSWFFACIGVFLLVGAILLLKIHLGDEIFYFSDRRTKFGDLFFKYFTHVGEAYFFVLISLIYLFVRYRTALLVPILGLSVMLVAFLTKSIFAQPRPWRYFQDLHLTDRLHLVAGVHVHGGNNSFPSGHTMAAFALYGFLAFILPQKRAVAVGLFTVALLVGISRIYLVQHFLKDVYLGAIMGVALAIIFHYVHNKYPKRSWADRSLQSKEHQKINV